MKAKSLFKLAYLLLKPFTPKLLLWVVKKYLQKKTGMIVCAAYFCGEELTISSRYLPCLAFKKILEKHFDKVRVYTMGDGYCLAASFDEVMA